MAQDFALGKVAKSGFLPAIEPVSAIAGKQQNPIVDKNDVDYERVKLFNEKSTNRNELTEEQQKQIRELERIDKEVRAHEQAHLSAGGGLVRGGVSFTYTQGPDGKQYATGGEVNIDTSKEDTPSKTIAKMQQVIAAAMAPADPSSQDYAVASAANKVISESRMQEAKEKAEENNQKTSESENTYQTNITVNPNSNKTTEQQTATVGLAKLKIYENFKNYDDIYKQQLGKTTNQVA
jgi:hypothetical protein